MSIPTLPPEEQKPHPVAHPFSVVGMLASIFVIVGLFGAVAYYVGPYIHSGQMASVISATLVDLTNEEREAEDLGTLKTNPVLTAAAQLKANDMAAKGYFAHVSPDGKEPWYWFKEAGYGFSTAGENLAVNFSDSEDVEEAWMNSPDHRANILNGKFKEIGIATAVGEYKGKKTIFVVQMFGTPRAGSSTTNVTVSTTPENPETIATADSDEDAEILGTEAVTAQPGATTTPSPAAVVSEPVAPTPSSMSPFDPLFASPQTALRLFYLLCGLIILSTLVFTTGREFERHHFRHVAAASCLLVLMTGLLIVADQVIFTAPIVHEVAVAH